MGHETAHAPPHLLVDSAAHAAAHSHPHRLVHPIGHYGPFADLAAAVTLLRHAYCPSPTAASSRSRRIVFSRAISRLTLGSSRCFVIWRVAFWGRRETRR